MASTKSYRDFILDQLSNLNPTSRQMMGEYLVYVDGVYFGGVFDDRFLVKKTYSNAWYILLEQLPYDGAKPMYLVENVDDKEYMESLATDTVNGLRK